MPLPPAAPVPAADLSGNWLFSTIGPGGESALCILKLETSGGKPTASVVFSPENVETSVADFRASGSKVNVAIKQVRTYKTRDGERKAASETALIGMTGKDTRVILGRAMPGGAAGVGVKDRAFRHTATVNLAEVRKGLTKYLDEYTAENPNRPFARPDRPMDMKTIRVIAMVQDDKTGEIAQALQIEVEGDATRPSGE